MVCCQDMLVEEMEWKIIITFLQNPRHYKLQILNLSGENSYLNDEMFPKIIRVKK